MTNRRAAAATTSMADASIDTNVKAGILPVQEIRAAIESGMIAAAAPITDAQLQPASLDLRLGTRAWRVQSSFLPGPGMGVEDKLARVAMHQIDLSGGRCWNAVVST